MDNKVLEQLKEEYNEALNRVQDLGDILAYCAEMNTSHCGQDAEEEAEKLPDGMAERLVDGYKNYCRQTLEDFLDRKITWWQFKKEMLMPDLVGLVKACGQDAKEEAGVSLKDLLGMEVVGVGKGKCDGCPMDHYQADCAKVELVGGDYLCLAKPQADEEEDGDNVMGDIREKAEAFIDYLDSVIGD